MNINTQFDYMIRFALLGDSKVGKTNMIIRFVDNSFCEYIPSTMGYDNKTKIINLDKKKVKVIIWDTVGQERFSAINKSFLQKVDGIMLVYDITDLESFQHMKKWIDLVKNYNDKLPTILVGNKIDKDDERIVTEEEGNNLAKENKLEFFETSAYNGKHIEKAFRLMSQKVFNYLMNESKLSSDNFTLTKRHNSEMKRRKKKYC